MSDGNIPTLKEMSLDSARYRWFRENIYQLLDWVDTCGYDVMKDACDEYIDERLGGVRES